MIQVILTAGAFLLIFFCAEILVRKYRVNVDSTRKITHILSGLIVFFTVYYLTRSEIIFLCISFALLLLCTKSFNLIKSIHSVERRTYGEIYFPLGVILSAIIFLPQDTLAFQFGILIMTLSDAAAALIGIPCGRHSVSIFKGKKSLEGSLAFFLTSVIIWLFFYKNFDHKSVLIPSVLTCVELLLSLGLDNLVLPTAAAYLFTIFTQS